MRGPGHPLDDAEFVAGLRPIASGGRVGSASGVARDLAGWDPDGHPVEVALDGLGPQVLLAFLSVRCAGCDEFWRTFAGLDGHHLPEGRPVDARRPDRQLPAGLVLAVITKGPESVAREEVVDLASQLSGVPVVMSDGAWADYRVTGYPFFVLVDSANRTVLGETVGFGWGDVLDMVRAARSAAT